ATRQREVLARAARAAASPGRLGGRSVRSMELYLEQPHQRSMLACSQGAARQCDPSGELLHLMRCCLLLRHRSCAHYSATTARTIFSTAQTVLCTRRLVPPIPLGVELRGCIFQCALLLAAALLQAVLCLPATRSGELRGDG